METLDELHRTARDVAARQNRREWQSALDPIGLLLHPTIARVASAETPTNAMTFASTGGDGVHFR